MSLFAHHRPWLAAIVVAATIACLAGIPRLEFDDNYRELFQTDADSFTDYEQLLRDFGSDENDCLVLIEADDVLSADALRVVRAIHNAASKLEGVAGVYSIFAARQAQRVGRYFLPVLPGDLSDTVRLESARETLREHPLVRGQLLSQNGRATLMVVQLADRWKRIADIEPIVTRLRELLARSTAGTPVSARITGLPAVRVDVTHAVKRDNFVFAVVGLGLAFLVAWYLFRRLTTLLIVCAAPLTGIIWTLGIIGWCGERLNVVNVLVPTLITVIGFTDALHIMFHIIHERDSGVAPQQAVRNALRLVGPACVLTCVTTAIGFGSLIAMQQPVFQRFGVTAALGAMLTTTAVLVVVPLLAGTRLGLKCTSHHSNSDKNLGARDLHSMNEDFSGNGAIWLRVIEMQLKRPALVCVLGFIGLLVALPLSLRMKPDFRYTENLPDRNEVNAAMRKCDELFGGSAVVNVVVDAGPGASLASPLLVEVLSAVHAGLEQQPALGRPLSLLNVLQSLPGDPNDLSSRVSELRYLPDDVLAHFVNAEHGKLLVSSRVRDLGSARLKTEFDEVQKRLSKIELRYPQFQLALTGMPVMSAYSAEGMIPALIRCLAFDLPILGIMFVTLRSIRLALISIVPNVLPLIVAAAGLVLLDVPLRFAAVMCFSVCLGIAVDDTIHIMVLYRRELKRDRNPTAAITRAMRAMVPVIVTTNTLIIIGFGVAMLSSMPTLRLFGALACLILIIGLLADLFFLPALVCVAEGVSTRRTPVQPRTTESAMPPVTSGSD